MSYGSSASRKPSATQSWSKGMLSFIAAAMCQGYGCGLIQSWSKERATLYVTVNSLNIENMVCFSGVLSPSVVFALKG